MKLEELFKEKWAIVGTYANDYVILGKTGQRIIYDRKTEEIVTRYSTIKPQTKDI